MIGKVTSGLGMGQYYISLEGYRSQFLRHLGYIPFPGTLNIKLDEPLDPKRIKAIEIESFGDGERTFGKCRCYKIIIQGIEAAIIRPDRSNYPADLVEVIAPVRLREKLCLFDGDTVELTIG
jgi:riboflavin kinase, archaea type